MHPAVHDDRIWFESNPAAVVRFRRAVAGEFQALAEHGGDAPTFRPSFCRSDVPARWVAVVNLMRLVDNRGVEIGAPTARLRLRIPALRSNYRKIHAERELKQAIAAELLSNLETDADTIAA